TAPPATKACLPALRSVRNTASTSCGTRSGASLVGIPLRRGVAAQEAQVEARKLRPAFRRGVADRLACVVERFAGGDRDGDARQLLRRAFLDDLARATRSEKVVRIEEKVHSAQPLPDDIPE